MKTNVQRPGQKNAQRRFFWKNTTFGGRSVEHQGRLGLAPASPINHPATPFTTLSLAVIVSLAACEATDPGKYSFETLELRDGGVATSAPATFAAERDASVLGAVSRMCTSDSCSNGSVCEPPSIEPASPDPQCRCLSGYEGVRCTVNVSNCESSSCENGGVCLVGPLGSICRCSVGFGGPTCATLARSCDDNPCLNEGSCTDIGVSGEDPSYACSCPDGFVGEHCEVNVNDCENNRCLNGGTCVDGIDSFTCTCPEGFEGNRCEVELAPCATPCPEEDPCLLPDAGQDCICSEDECEQALEAPVDPCEPRPCQNNGQCLTLDSQFECDCAGTGFEGETCSVDIDECSVSPCQNGGQCVNLNNRFACNCEDTGFEGETCTTPIERPNGARCENENQCESGNCVASARIPNVTVCCSEPCDSGLCAVQAGNVTTCRGPVGANCTTDAQCANLDCRQFFDDVDRDGFAVAGAVRSGHCFDVGLVGFTARAPIAGAVDCAGEDARVHPDVTEFQSAGASGQGSFDYNCDGQEEPELSLFNSAACQLLTATAACSSVQDGFDPAAPLPSCGQVGELFSCRAANIAGPCVPTVVAPNTLQRCR